MSTIAIDSSTAPQPLRGTRVISIALNVPGPVAASRLTALGATVTKVEPPSGDFLERAAPAWYAELVTGQELLRLDLKDPGGRARLDELLAVGDLFIASTRPAALERLGLGRDAVRTRHPHLCTVSIVGHPSPLADLAGHDLTYQAEAGLVTPPALPVSLFSDIATGLAATTAALELLLTRNRTGSGAWREVALADVAHLLAAPRHHGLTLPSGPLGGGLPAYGLYEASDGTVAIAALEPHFMERLVAGLGLTGGDASLIAASVRRRRVAELVAFGRAHDIPIAAVSVP